MQFWIWSSDGRFKEQLIGTSHWVGMPMRRYHFDLLDTSDVTDVKGAVLHDDHQARSVALKLVHEVRARNPELIGRGYKIRVRDESGDEISQLAIDQTPKDGDGL
jgi:hypothetical protein